MRTASEALWLSSRGTNTEDYDRPNKPSDSERILRTKVGDPSVMHQMVRK